MVDDGSRQECQVFFENIEKKDGCTVIHHKVNRGKGRALKTAFEYYLHNFDTGYYKGVVTADADGQHSTEDIYRAAECLCGYGQEDVLVLGTRNFNEEQVPFKSRKGNKITRRIFQLLYGKHIQDTQTGLRAISNKFINRCVSLDGERFEYEINMLIAAVCRKVNIVEVPIQTVYFEDNRETHFDPIKDSIKIYKVMFASFFVFVCSGLVSMLVDQGLFAVLQKLCLSSIPKVVSIPIATLFARIGSSYLNYSINKRIVFNAKEKRAIVRYYILCIIQMFTSAMCVYLLYTISRFDTSLLKILVDTVLFFGSYCIQRMWVFKEGQ